MGCCSPTGGRRLGEGLCLALPSASCSRLTDSPLVSTLSVPLCRGAPGRPPSQLHMGRSWHRVCILPLVTLCNLEAWRAQLRTQRKVKGCLVPSFRAPGTTLCPHKLEKMPPLASGLQELNSVIVSREATVWGQNTAHASDIVLCLALSSLLLLSFSKFKHITFCKPQTQDWEGQWSNPQDSPETGWNRAGPGPQTPGS